VPRFVKQAIAGRALTVFGDGSQTRCFCHVMDVVGALMKLVDTPRSVGEVFNIGSTEEVSILELAETVKRLASSSSDIVFVPYDEAYEEGFEDMPRRVPDTTKIDELVGFRPTYTLDGIIRSVIEYQRGTTASRLTAAEPASIVSPSPLSR
jgi:UDP-glucose 4-epimerase